MTHEHRPTKTPPYRIMGIDPGTNYMGYGVLEVDGRTLRSVVLGDIDLHKLTDPYAKLRYIFERVGALIDEYRPREVALESPFFGENVQSMLKLGRAQGVAMAAALSRNLPVTEYAPSRIKQSITGRGSAAKEQVARHRLPDTLGRTAAAASRCHRRHGRRPVSLLHRQQPASGRHGRRPGQRAGRRQEGRLEKRLAELGTVSAAASRTGDQISTEKPTVDLQQITIILHFFRNFFTK